MVVCQVLFYVAGRWVERSRPWAGAPLLWSSKQPLYESPRTVAAAEADQRRFRR